MTKVFSVAAVAMTVKNLATDMYSAATTLEATEAKFNTVFAGFTDTAQETIDRFQSLTPATESSTRSMMSGIQDLLVPMGFMRSEATELTADTMDLVGALTNFNSATHSAEDVASAFSSALTGEYTSLKALGIQISATTIEEYILANGMANTTTEITSQMKATAMLEMAYSQSTDALAAYNEESLDTQTRMGLLKASFTDTFAEAGQSLLPKLNDGLIMFQSHMPTIINMIYAFEDTFGAVIDITSVVFNILMSIVGVVVDNWSVLSPIILGVAGSFGVYTIATKGAAVATGIATTATKAWTAAQAALNAVMDLNPVAQAVIGIIVLVAAIYAGVSAYNKLTDSTISATGIIFGAFTWLGAMCINLLVGTLNAGIEILWSRFVNPAISIIEWVLNVFNGGFDSFGAACANLLGQLIGYFLEFGQVVTTIIDAIFGTDWTSGLESLQSSITAWGKNDTAITLSREAPTIDYRMDLTDAWNAGYSTGYALEDYLGANSSSLASETFAIDEFASTLSDIATDTSSISECISQTAEELAYLRDLAEQEAVNRFTTAEVKIDMTGMTNRIDSDMDLDGVITKLTEGFAEALEFTAEGVHV